jgi:hypothetical protein
VLVRPLGHQEGGCLQLEGFSIQVNVPVRVTPGFA